MQVCVQVDEPTKGLCAGVSVSVYANVFVYAPTCVLVSMHPMDSL